MASKVYSMTPKEIVSELDKYIIGQDEAKKIGGNSAEKQIQTKPASRGTERRNNSEEHPDDGTYGLWQDRNCKKTGKAHGRAVRQG